MRNVDKRSEEVLTLLIGAFIDTGSAIGSSTLAKRLNRRLSPATIRNVMSDLERQGFLTHRHTSGGRMPTDKGMRYYIDRLLKIEPLTEGWVGDIRRRYKNASYSVSDMFRKTSQILSGLSTYAGLVVAPHLNDVVIKHMEFILLSKNRMLGIFVGRDGTVENRIIKVNCQFNYSELEKINNYCNRAFYGLTLSEAKNRIQKEIREAEAEYDRLINQALDLLKSMILDMEESELFVDGGSQLLQAPDFSDIDKATSVLDMLEEKKQLIDLLNSAIGAEKINIFIGSESGYNAISNCSVVATPYKKEGKVLGTLGIIGPTRMNYSKVIPIVNCTAKLVGNFLDGEDIYDG